MSTKYLVAVILFLLALTSCEVTPLGAPADPAAGTGTGTTLPTSGQNPSKGTRVIEMEGGWLFNFKTHGNSGVISWSDTNGHVITWPNGQTSWMVWDPVKLQYTWDGPDPDNGGLIIHFTGSFSNPPPIIQGGIKETLPTGVNISGTLSGNKNPPLPSAKG